jgi:hypothetical protein
VRSERGFPQQYRSSVARRHNPIGVMTPTVRQAPAILARSVIRVGRDFQGGQRKAIAQQGCVKRVFPCDKVNKFPAS